MAILQKGHPIFAAKLLIQKVAVSFAVVPSIMDSWTTESISSSRPIPERDHLGDYWPKVSSADFVDARHFEAPTIVFKPEFVWNDTATEDNSAEFEVGVVSQNPGHNERAEAVGDYRTIGTFMHGERMPYLLRDIVDDCACEELPRK